MTTQKPKVLNRKHDFIPFDAIFVGRPSKFGNPYKIGRDGTRAEVIAKYRCRVLNILMFTDSHWLDNLRDHDLVCWCAPEPCHADVLLELANRPISPSGGNEQEGVNELMSKLWRDENETL